jgi:DNA polymerase-3 subunit delta
MWTLIFLTILNVFFYSSTGNLESANDPNSVMPEIKYNLLKKYLKDLKGDPQIRFSQVYLIFGEELLVKTAYDDLLEILLPVANRTANYEPMDGTIENIYDVIERVNTFSLMAGIKVVAMRESRIFYTQRDKNRLLEISKKAYDEDNLKKAAKYVLSLMGNMNLSFEDVDKSNREKALKLNADMARGDEWLDDIIAYCQENNLTIPEPADESALLRKAIEKGFPKNNHLLITTDRVDKRRSLYKAINNQGIVIDCAVPGGDRRADRMAQEGVLLEKMTEILKPNKKEMDKGAYRALVDMTGFDLRTFCGSLEKLIHYVGKRNTITVEDVESVSKRTKKDPIYDLTNASADRHTERSLFFLSSLLAAEFHPLQVLTAIVNQIRRLILAKDFTKSPQAKDWHAGLSYNLFQQNIMPSIVAYDRTLLETLEDWEDSDSHTLDVDQGKAEKKIKIKTDLLLARNPNNAYPVYQLLKKSERYSKTELMAAFSYLNEADTQLKISAQNPKLILERLIFRICHSQKRVPGSRHQA